MTKSQIAILQSYGRSILAGFITLYLAGVTDYQSYVYAFVAAIAPVALRYLNKNDLAFGKINGKMSADELATEAVKVVEAAVKAAPKKAAPKQLEQVANPKRTKTPAKKNTAKESAKK